MLRLWKKASSEFAMGADGGICWVYLNKPEYQEKLLKILPWRLLTWDRYYDYINEHAGHDHFMHEIPPNTVSATYGTSQDVSLKDLYFVLGDFQFYIEEWGTDLLTLQEILEIGLTKVQEKRKSHSTWYYGDLNSIEKILVASYEYNILGENGQNILSMTFKDWKDQLIDCCKLSHNQHGTYISVGSVETWT